MTRGLGLPERGEPLQAPMEEAPACMFTMSSYRIFTGTSCCVGCWCAAACTACTLTFCQFAASAGQQGAQQSDGKQIQDPENMVYF